MGRSVNVPRDAVAVAYVAPYDVVIADPPFEVPVDVDQVAEGLKQAFPSFESAPAWSRLDNETRVLLQSRLVQVAVSEYCGLYAFAIVPRRDRSDLVNLAEQWARRVESKFRAIVHAQGRGLEPWSRASNGEVLYGRAR